MTPSTPSRDGQLAEELREHVEVLERTVGGCSATIGEMADRLCECFEGGNKLLVCGNGGSAADAQHVAAEFVGRFREERAALAAIALTTDSSVLTSIANDSSFEKVFSRQVEALGTKGDLLAGISTSGKSANVLRALDVARSRGLVTIGFTGARGQALAAKCDLCLVVPSEVTARVQEAHAFVWHYLCCVVEARQRSVRQPAGPG